MDMHKKNELVPYGKVPIGFEAIYTGKSSTEKSERIEENRIYSSDESDNEIMRWPIWGMVMPGEEGKWTKEIHHLNKVQESFGELDEETRRIRAHIGSLVLCDNGVPVTIDEILNALGRGKLPRNAFHNGCWMSPFWGEERSTQPSHVECIQVIESVLRSYLEGMAGDNLIREYPDAEGFIRRIHDWLPPYDELAKVQKLLMERLLLPFDYFSKRTEDYKTVHKNCFEEGGRGEKLDEEISKEAGLPKIYANYKQEYKDALQEIKDPEKKELYKICGMMAHGLHGISDCHHSTFRWIERWIYAIGTGSWEVESRNENSERERLGKLLFGYAYALDKWLMKKPMQFLLLDLGHAGLEVDPKNEILRVYAYLGEDRTPIKKWLAACLWYKLVLEPPASLYKWGWAYKDLLTHLDEKGISIKEWMENELSP